MHDRLDKLNTHHVGKKLSFPGSKLSFYFINNRQQMKFLWFSRENRNTKIGGGEASLGKAKHKILKLNPSPWEVAMIKDTLARINPLARDIPIPLKGVHKIEQ